MTNVMHVNGLGLTLQCKCKCKINMFIWFYTAMYKNVNVKQMHLFDFTWSCKTMLKGRF
jgi:hypothetical protein